MLLNIRVKLGGRSIDVHSVASNVVIGRDPECAIHLDNLGVSRQHSAIEFDGDHVYVRDLGSSNGTLVGGERVERRELRNGDVVQVGRFTLEVEFRNTANLRGEPMRPRTPPLDTIRTDEPAAAAPGNAAQAGDARGHRSRGRVGMYVAFGLVATAAAVAFLIVT
jgi:pSer/pThr/pTyr-binding forkhead associated (FHA) protein